MEERVNNCLEDDSDCVERNISVRQEVVVTLKTLCNLGSSTSRWTHGRNKDDVNNSVEWFVLILTVVPAAMITLLSEQLNWWLCSISFLLWHIQVIYEDDVLFAKRWTVHALSSLFEFLIQEILKILSLIGTSLC